MGWSRGVVGTPGGLRPTPQARILPARLVLGFCSWVDEGSLCWEAGPSQPSLDCRRDPGGFCRDWEEEEVGAPSP